MTNQIDPQNTFTEAPASWNTTYINPDGFICTLTLRNGNGIQLLDRAAVAMNHLLATGCKPSNRYGNGSGNGTGNGAPASAADPLLCPIHQVKMILHKKGDQHWLSHKLDDGSWCRGK